MSVRFNPFTGSFDEVSTVGSGNLDMNLYEILEFRVENVGSLPLGGNKGRLVYLTTDNNLYLDQG